MPGPRSSSCCAATPPHREEPTREVHAAVHEPREVLGGYDIIDVPDLDVALDWAARSPGAIGNGSVQVRPVAEIEVEV
ncbi:YciI family protein [Micromonospora sp. NPDC049102]|uniref:YciI family protein n=1 Tax=Micromonospora sp. NPDC049102 TaxID=3364265 RepID=UPI00372379C4